MRVTIIGAGAWGGALAQVASDGNRNEVTLWTRSEDEAAYIRKTRRIPILEKKEIEHTINESIIVTSSIEDAVRDSEMIVFVIPSFAIRSVAEQVVKVITKPTVFVTATKGIEPKTHFMMSEVVEDVIPENLRKGVVALTGPTHAEEVVVHKKTAIVAACPDIEVAKEVQDVFTNKTYFRVYVNDDRIGSEIGGALKNIIAVISGMLNEFELGDNAQAALITRGLFEITKIGVAVGAQERTFSGLAGVGDLIVTSTSRHSRNYQAGRMLAQGMSAKEVEEKTGATIEGFHAVTAAMEIIKEKNIYAPLICLLKELLDEKITPEEILVLAFDREKTDEFADLYK